MKVMFDNSSDYPLGPINSLNFKKLENEKNNLMFYYGIHPGYRMPRPSNFKYNIYFETEEPNGLSEGQLPHQRGNWDLNFWTKIVNICPYSADWENKIYNTDKFVNYVYPFDEELLIKDFTKKYDVIYVGGLHGRHGIFHNIVNSIKQFNYRFVSMWGYPGVTDLNVSLETKMNIWAQSKITVCANILSENSVNQYSSRMKVLPKWEENKAFSHIDQGIMPQMKPRITDAAISKSLILILKDPWNVIETWFKPDVHFIYFNSFGELPSKIKWCLDNWDFCEKITNNMFEEYMNKYTIKNFYNYLLKDYDQ